MAVTKSGTGTYELVLECGTGMQELRDVTLRDVGMWDTGM